MEGEIHETKKRVRKQILPGDSRKEHSATVTLVLANGDMSGF